MVEVFKTNVTSKHQAKKLVSLIENNFEGYKANFDLDDCDHILRVATQLPIVEKQPVISMLKDMGVVAEVLPDDIENMNDLIRPGLFFYGCGLAKFMAFRDNG
jgi:hypothetical protein